MSRNERNAIAWPIVDGALETLAARGRRVVRAVAVAVDGLLALEGGVEQV